MRDRSALVPAAALLMLSTCAPAGDITPQIHVAPGAAARSLWIGRKQEAPIPPARVHPMGDKEALSGPNAIGQPGDLVLENSEVVFVIERLGRSSGFAESGGNIVDAADAKLRMDELGQVFTFFGTFPRQALYEKLSSGTSPDGSAWVMAEGKELYAPDIRVKTRYQLGAADRALLIETTLTNTGASPSDKLGLGDAVQWGGAEKTAPGKAPGFKGPSQGPYLGAVGRFSSYALTSTDGAIEAINGSSWSDTFQKRDVVLAPGQSVQYARVFLVGERPDTAGLVAELTKTAGQPVGSLDVHLLGHDGTPVTVPKGARISLGHKGQEVLSLVAASDGNSVLGEAPPGHYELRYTGGGGRRHDPSAALFAVDILPGRTTKANLVVTRAGRLKAFCEELNRAGGRPCKVTVEGDGGTATPDFGPPHASGPAKNQITTHDGALDVPLAPGTYRVTASRGPEYNAAQSTVVVGEDKAAEFRATLERVVDTRGYLATDFHQHSMLGADAPVALRDRVIANVAEGVEVAVASEHNVVADLQPYVRELHLENELVELPGVELTTDASKKPWGHANVFPLTPDPSKERGGAPAVREKTARELFAQYRAMSEPHIIQINHPRAGITGYFDQLKFDRKTGTSADPAYDPEFDALEVWNGRNVDARDAVKEDFFAILRSGRPMTATADTDTHGVVGQEAGYPRTYVRVTDDGPPGAFGAERRAELVRGVRERRDVVISNGPFMRVSVKTELKDYGEAIGKVVRGHSVEVKVHVAAAPWVDVDKVRVERVVDGGTAIEQAVNLSSARAADVTLRFRAAKDEAFVVVATGSKSLAPILAGDPKELQPYAMSGAIWVDADGDGKSLGRKP
jgi:hypothetical protein